MALIQIADKDLMNMRSLLHEACLRIEGMPCPRAGAKPGTASFDAGRRAIKQINRALKRIYGHDCCAETYMPDPPVVVEPVHLALGAPQWRTSPTGYLCGASVAPSPQVTFSYLEPYVTCSECLRLIGVRQEQQRRDEMLPPPLPPYPNPLGRNYMSAGPMGPHEGAEHDYEDMS